MAEVKLMGTFALSSNDMGSFIMYVRSDFAILDRALGSSLRFLTVQGSWKWIILAI